jgi:hypothetical protein
MFEGKYFLNRFALVTVNVVRYVMAVKLGRSPPPVIYSAQILVVFGEKFFLADVRLQRERRKRLFRRWKKRPRRGEQLDAGRCMKVFQEREFYEIFMLEHTFNDSQHWQIMKAGFN